MALVCCTFDIESRTRNCLDLYTPVRNTRNDARRKSQISERAVPSHAHKSIYIYIFRLFSFSLAYAPRPYPLQRGASKKALLLVFISSYTISKPQPAAALYARLYAALCFFLLSPHLYIPTALLPYSSYTIFIFLHGFSTSVTAN